MFCAKKIEGVICFACSKAGRTLLPPAKINLAGGYWRLKCRFFLDNWTNVVLRKVS
jgi:hypothetical protein